MEIFDGEERYLLVRLNSTKMDNTLSYYWYPKRKTLRYERYLNNKIVDAFKTLKELKMFVNFDIFEQYDWNNNEFLWQVDGKSEQFIGDHLKINIYTR